MRSNLHGNMLSASLRSIDTIPRQSRSDIILSIPIAFLITFPLLNSN
jgi:hypothetical protein